MWNTWLLCLTSTLGSCFELSWVRVGRTRTLKESCNDLIFYLPDSAGYSACLAWWKVRTAHGYRSALNYCATPVYVHVGRVCPTSPLHSAPNAMTTSSHILLWYCQQQNEHHRPPAVIFLGPGEEGKRNLGRPLITMCSNPCCVGSRTIFPGRFQFRF